MKENIFHLMDEGDFDMARHEVYKAGPHAWGCFVEYQKYRQGSASNAHGTLTRYMEFCQPSHIGINWHMKCGKCGRSDKQHRHTDMLAVDILPSTGEELNLCIKDLLCGTEKRACTISPNTRAIRDMINMMGDEDTRHPSNPNSDDLDHQRAVDESLETHLLKEADKSACVCDGSMDVHCCVTHIGKFLIVKQECVKEIGWKIRPRTKKKKRESAKPKSSLLFTEIDLNGLNVAGFVGTVKYVIFSDGGHFKVAVNGVNNQWIVHDGLCGWCIGKHGDSEFGRWFQCDQFEIAHIVYEMSINSLGVNLEEPCLKPRLDISSIGRRCMLEMSQQIWKSIDDHKEDGDAGVCWDFDIRLQAIDEVVKKLDIVSIRHVLEKYSERNLPEEMEGVRREVAFKLHGETFKVSMDEYGYAIWKLPTELWEKVKNAIYGELPKENELEPIFTCRKNSKTMTKKLKESWLLNEHDGATYSDGKRLQGSLLSFHESSEKKRFEEWLQMKTGGSSLVVLHNCKVLVTREHCHRQEMHTDFYVDEPDDQRLFFGILVLQNPGSIWVKRRHGNAELEEPLQPGEVFLGRGSLIHGGGTMPGVRLHFLYLGEKEREKYHNYNETTFVDGK